MIKVSNLFQKLGRFAASYKLSMLALGLTITIIFGLGMVDLKLESEPQNLWVNKEGRTNKEQTYFMEKFGAFFRINQLIYKLESPSDEDDLFTKDYLLDLYYIQKVIMTRTAMDQNYSINIDDLCFKPVSTRSCYLPSPLDYWKLDASALFIDDNVKEISKCLKAKDDSSITCSDRNGIPILREVVFGGLECIKDPSECTNECTPCAVKAKTLTVSMMLNNDGFTKSNAETWERDVFEDTINQYNQGKLNISQYLTNETIYSFKPPKKAVITYLAERSIPDELVEETNQNVFVVVVSYIIMFLYISVAIGSFPNAVHSGFLVGICGIFVVGFSIISSFGLSSYIGVGVSMISAEVVPFLILAIGVDNMFIIANASKRMENLNLSVPDQMGEALKEVGPSITTAAICEFLAFFVGFITYIPALQSFCLVAALAVMFDYFLQITLFIAVLAMDEERKRKNLCDLFPCIEIQNPKPPRSELVKTVIDKYYIPVLFTRVVKILVIITFCALIIMSGVGLSKLDLGLDQQVSLIKDSTTYKYFNDLAEFGEAGPPAYVVLKNINYTNQNDLEVLSNMADTLSKLTTYVQPPLYQWITSYNQLYNPGGDWKKDCYVTPEVTALSYSEKIKFFKNVKIDSVCCKKYGICGETFEKDIVQDDDGNLVASRFRFQHRPLRVSDDFINAFVKTRQIVDHFSNKLEQGKEAFVYSLFYVYFEQYTYVKGIAIQNVLLAVGVVYAAVLIMKNARSAFYIFLCCFCTTFDLIGGCALLNKLSGGYQIQINAVSVVNLIVCVGLSVEFSVHIMLQYMNCIGSREERAKSSLSIMGSSVVVGIAITKFIGVIVLGFANSTLFTLYYFRMFMCIIVLGFFHGLVFLPVILSLVGPRGSKSNFVGDLKKIA